MARSENPEDLRVTLEPFDAERMFHLLALHPGPEISCPAAAALTGLSSAATRRLVDLLVSDHLIEQVAEDRYQFNDLRRAYAMDQVSIKETEESRGGALRRMFDWYLYTTIAAVAAAQDFSAPVVTDPVPVDCAPLSFDTAAQAIAWYEAERVNLLAATREAARMGQDGWAWRIPAALFPIHNVLRIPSDDWAAMAQLGLLAARRVEARAGEGALLAGLGVTSYYARRLDEAIEHLGRAIEVMRDLGDLGGQARCLNVLGLISILSRDLGTALDRFAQVAEFARRMPSRRWEGIAVQNRGYAYGEHGQFEVAIELTRQTLVIFDEDGGHPRQAFDSLLNLAQFHRELGRFDDATRYLDSADDLAARLGGQGLTTLAELKRAHLRLATGAHVNALATFQHAAVLCLALGDRAGEVEAIDGTGQGYAAMNRADDAATFHRRAAAGYEELGDFWHQALALARLSTALDQVEEPEEAELCRNQVLDLIAGLDDPPAEALRMQVTEHPPGRHQG